MFKNSEEKSGTKLIVLKLSGIPTVLKALLVIIGSLKSKIIPTLFSINMPLSFPAQWLILNFTKP
jgi:hypothetical protein